MFEAVSNKDKTDYIPTSGKQISTHFLDPTEKNHQSSVHCQGLDEKQLSALDA